LTAGHCGAVRGWRTGHGWHLRDRAYPVQRLQRSRTLPTA